MALQMVLQKHQINKIDNIKFWNKNNNNNDTLKVMLDFSTNKKKITKTFLKLFKKVFFQNLKKINFQGLIRPFHW